MTDTVTPEKARLEAIAQQIVDKRRQYETADAKIAEINEQQQVLVADIDAEIEALHKRREEVLAAHPRAAEQAALVDESQFAQQEYKELCGAAIKAWRIQGKTLPVKGGKVTKSTRKGVSVEDTRAAAESLMKRELWAYVKKLDVDVAGIRPLLDVSPGVPGIVPADKESIRVSLEAS